MQQIGPLQECYGSQGCLGVDERPKVARSVVARPHDHHLRRRILLEVIQQAFLGGGIHGATPGTFGIRAIPAFVLVGPDGKIVARGMRGDEIKKQVARALANKP